MKKLKVEFEFYDEQTDPGRFMNIDDLKDDILSNYDINHMGWEVKKLKIKRIK